VARGEWSEAAKRTCRCVSLVDEMEARWDSMSGRMTTAASPICGLDHTCCGYDAPGCTSGGVGAGCLSLALASGSYFRPHPDPPPCQYTHLDIE
jgi:hypothetical protein